MTRALMTCLLAAALAAPVSAAAPASQPSGVPTILSLPRPKGGEWMGLYVLGKKAGWAYSELREGSYEGTKAIVAVSHVTLQASVGGANMHRDIRDERIYEHKDGGRLLAFRQEKHGDGGDETLLGTCSPRGVELRRIRPNQPDEVRHLPATAETVEHADAVRIVAFSKKPLEGMSLDLENKLADKKERTELVGEASVTAAGVTVPVVKVKSSEQDSNLAMVSTVALDGRELELDFGGVMVGKAESEQIAKQLDKVDIFNLTRVVIAKPVPDDVREPPATVVWRVQGLGTDMKLPSTRQTLKGAPDGSAVLTIRSRLPKARAKRPFTSAATSELQESLKTNLSVDWDAPAIVVKAKEIVGGEKDAWAAARKLNHFVNGYLEKAYGSSSDRATDVLATAKGDCTEHALLLTALLRASGIPARRIDGLVYMKAADGVPALYWHEWVQAWVGEWVEMDPTFNEEIADPTHIALGTEARVDTAGLIGKLKLEMVDARASAGTAVPRRRTP